MCTPQEAIEAVRNTWSHGTDVETILLEIFLVLLQRVTVYTTKQWVVYVGVEDTRLVGRRKREREKW